MVATSPLPTRSRLRAGLLAMTAVLGVTVPAVVSLTAGGTVAAVAQTSAGLTTNGELSASSVRAGDWVPSSSRTM